MHDPDNMIGYYARRAEEYEEVYHRDDPVRRVAQERLARTINTHLNGLDVLELACGTGHWTQKLSASAKSIIATDVNTEVMEVAKRRTYQCDVRFEKQDIYNFTFKEHTFSGGMAHFLFSHIPKSEIDTFLKSFHRTLQPGAHVVISDDVLSPLDTPIHKPNDVNTYSERHLQDGSKYLILKNFYDTDELVSMFRKHVKNFSSKNVYQDNYYWYVTYTIV